MATTIGSAMQEDAPCREELLGDIVARLQRGELAPILLPLTPDL